MKNKITSHHCQLILLCLVLFVIDSCKKDDETKVISEPPVQAELNDPNTVTDKDGNIYHTVKIGTQVWMVENLKVTHYRNGDPITIVPTAWLSTTTGAYCNVYNDTSHTSAYGRYYNYYAIEDSRKICPEGWHVPSDAEWTTLSAFLGSDAVAGGKIKEAGNVHWVSPNTGATNSSGFTAMPAGGRVIAGTCVVWGGINRQAFFWSSTIINSKVVCRQLINQTTYFSSCYLNEKGNGYSIRCIKD